MATQQDGGPSVSLGTDEVVFEQLDSYPWHSDPEFQSGLQAILGSDPSPDQAEHLTLRARCFYFSRYSRPLFLSHFRRLIFSMRRKNNIPVDFNGYKTWRSEHVVPSLPNGISSTAAAPLESFLSGSGLSSVGTNRPKPDPAMNNSEPPAPYPTSFSQIVELITNGQPIPGIKEVPNTVLEGQATQTTTAKRKKPWEKDDLGDGEESTVTASNA